MTVVDFIHGQSSHHVLKRYHRNSYQHSVVLFIMLYKVVLTFKSVDQTLVCDHSNESSTFKWCCLFFDTFTKRNSRFFPRFWTKHTWEWQGIDKEPTLGQLKDDCAWIQKKRSQFYPNNRWANQIAFNLHFQVKPVLSFFVRMYIFIPRLNILIFMPILGWKYS